MKTVGFDRFLIAFTAIVSALSSRRSAGIGGAEVGPCSKSWPMRPSLKGWGSTVLWLKGGVPPFQISPDPPVHRALPADCRQTRKLGDLSSSAGFWVSEGRKVLPGWAKTRPCSHSEALSYLFQVFGRPWGAQALRFHFSAHEPILVEHRPQAWRLDTGAACQIERKGWGSSVYLPKGGVHPFRHFAEPPIDLAATFAELFQSHPSMSSACGPNTPCSGLQRVGFIRLASQKGGVLPFLACKGWGSSVSSPSDRDDRRPPGALTPDGTTISSAEVASEGWGSSVLDSKRDEPHPFEP